MGIKLEWLDKEKDEAIITIKETRKRWFFFGKDFTEITKYRGSCTVWHELPNCKRPGTKTEYWLCAIWQKHRYESEAIDG